jgi:hypothetical protein
VRGGQHSRNGWRGRRAARATLLLLAAVLATHAAAQRIPGSGTGGSAGVMAPHPMPPAGAAITPPVLTPPVLTPPVLAPSVTAPMPAPPIAAPAAPAPAAPAITAPAAPARVVRFRCEVAPQDQSCREPGTSDGGGGDEDCSCARDYCHTTAAGIRVCDKLQ